MYCLSSLLAGAAIAAASGFDTPTCEPIGNSTHTIDPSMQATDRTPPNLPNLSPGEMHHANASSQSDGCGGAQCPDATYLGFEAEATDDMTPRNHIGYQFSLAKGTLPPGLSLPATAIEPIGGRLRLYFDSNDVKLDPVDLAFQLQIVAIDLAGNESTPRLTYGSGGEPGDCSVARGAAPGPGIGWIALLTVVAAIRRRKRPASRTPSAPRRRRPCSLFLRCPAPREQDVTRPPGR